MDYTQKSLPDSDAHIEALINWVKEHGGIINIEVRRDVKSNLRGIYASQDLTDPDTPIISIPNKLIVSPLHVQQQPIGPNASYQDLFNLCPQLFDPKHPYEPNDKVPTKMENQYGEYFQLTLFLILEKLKGS